MQRTLDYSKPPPVPPDDRIDHAAEVVARLGEVKALDGWHATFHRANLECSGVWPPTDFDLMLGDFEVPIESWLRDEVEPDDSWSRYQERCLLAVRHGIERTDLELRHMRECLSKAEVG